MSQSDIDYTKKWLPEVLKSHIEDNRLNPRFWKRSEKSVLTTLRNDRLEKSGVRRLQTYQKGFDALEESDKEKIYDLYMELRSDKSKKNFDPWVEDEEDELKEYNTQSNFYPPLKDQPMTTKLKGIDNFLAGIPPGQKQSFEKLGMDELKQIVGELNQRINRITPMMSVEGGKEYLEKKRPNDHENWSYKLEDLDNDKKTPDNILWYTPEDKLYTVDGWTTHRPRPNDIGFENYMTTHQTKQKRKDESYGSIVQAKKQAKRAALSLYDKFRDVITDPVAKTMFKKDGKFGDGSTITGDLVAPFMSKLAGFIKRNCLVKDMVLAVEPGAIKYDFDEDPHNVIGKNKKTWVETTEKLGEDKLKQRYIPLTQACVANYIRRKRLDVPVYNTASGIDLIELKKDPSEIASSSASSSRGALDIQ